MSYKVLISEHVHEQGIELFRRTKGFTAEVKAEVGRDSLLKLIGEYDALVIGSTFIVDAELIRAAPKLKVVGIAGASLDNVDVSEATRRGIAVMNTPGGDTVAKAEHTLTLLMTMHRHIPQAAASMKEGKWDKKKYQGREIAGKTLGVIGLGRVGSAVCRLASQGLKMNVLAYAPEMTQEAASLVGAKPASLEKIFSDSDVITIHTPLNAETEGLLAAKAFAKMKAGVMIINCASSEIIDRPALLEALESGKVAAAALDVYDVPPPEGDPLVMHPRVISTPRLGASTTEAQINLAVAVSKQIIDYLEEGAAKNAVNLPAIGAPEAGRMRPYFDLARRLAAVLAWLAPAAITKMEVEYRGEIATWNLKPMTNAALVGLLGRFEGSEVNHVNAAAIADERGISVSETTCAEGQDYASSLVVRTTYADGTSRSLQGALIKRQGDEPRIIGIDQFITEAVPAGPMLIVTNRDIPGMIAGISGTLARRGINIAQMNLSRVAVGGTALSIINVDEPVDDETLESIRQIEGILGVKQVIVDS